ncbi:DNA primase [Luteibaculum oceani]|uniref:DNA primase n=1 Tax=Luteibaculum oceani TaxID=1294296 RepID=UPI001476CCE0|nr:DNA primase [Luteibaculum oceani]
MIPKETIQQIIDSASIEEVIGEFVALKKSGSNFKGLSPFTDEKTPSFFVSPSKQIFKCFSTGKGGNVVSFLMEHEKWTYPEALKWLAGKYNILIEEKEQSPEQIQARSERESIAALNRFAADYFEDCLHQTEEGKNIGLSYFYEREFTDATIKEFNLGYNPEKDGITQEALKNQFNQKYLLAAGLSKEGRSGLYDFLRGRVIFPIHNLSGQVLGFGARTLKADKKIPKYLNSPENELYNKSKVLYGLYQAKNTITKEDNCFLVEGYTDVISLHQAGIKNVVASSGTSLTKDQVKLIRRYTKNVTILFDGDSAGIKASFRGIDLFLQEDLAVKACLFPDGEDPDSFAKKHAREEVLDFIQDNAKDFVSFKASILTEGQELNDPIKKVAVLREMAETISQISDPLARNVYGKNCAGLLDIDEAVLLKEVNKYLRGKARENLKQGFDSDQIEGEITARIAGTEIPTEKQNLKKGLSADIQEREILRLLLQYGDKQFLYREKDGAGEIIEAEVGVRDFILETLDADEITFQSEKHQKLLAFIRENENFSEAIKWVEDSEITSLYADIITPAYELSPNWEKKHFIFTNKEEANLNLAITKTLYTYQLLRVEMEIRDIQEALKTTRSEDEMMELLRNQKEYDRAKSQLSARLSRVIIR